MNDDDREFSPNWASPPCETVIDWLEENKVSHLDFACRMGWNMDLVKRFLANDVHINGSIATRLGALMGIPANFWLTRQLQYDADIKRLREAGYGDEKLPTDGSEIKDPEMVEIFLYENRVGHHHARVRYKGLEVRSAIEYIYRQPLHAKFTMSTIRKTLDLVRGMAEAMEESDGSGREEEESSSSRDAGAVEPVSGS